LAAEVEATESTANKKLAATRMREKEEADRALNGERVARETAERELLDVKRMLREVEARDALIKTTGPRVANTFAAARVQDASANRRAGSECDSKMEAAEATILELE
jgi:hypothetical protein